MKFPFIATLVAAVAMGSAAFADPVPVVIRGEVDSYAPGALKVATRSGEVLDIATPEALQIVSILPRTLADVAEGDSVSTTAVPDADGKLKALQVSILPAQLAGQNEGQKPWDIAPDSVMTNAVITGVTTTVGNEEISMKYADKTVTMTVPADTPVMAFGQGDAAQLVKGADVFIVAMKGDDGVLSTNRVIAETDGFKPPM